MKAVVSSVVMKKEKDIFSTSEHECRTTFKKDVRCIKILVGVVYGKIN